MRSCGAIRARLEAATSIRLTCDAVLILDFILYTLAGMYIDSVLPSAFREFGVPRERPLPPSLPPPCSTRCAYPATTPSSPAVPWYYPVLPSYWAETCGCCRCCRPRRGQRMPLLPAAQQHNEAKPPPPPPPPRWYHAIPGLGPRAVYMPNRNP